MSSTKERWSTPFWRLSLLYKDNLLQWHQICLPTNFGLNTPMSFKFNLKIRRTLNTFQRFGSQTYLRYCQLLTRWGDSRFDPKIQIVCGVESAHNNYYKLTSQATSRTRNVSFASVVGWGDLWVYSVSPYTRVAKSIRSQGDIFQFSLVKLREYPTTTLNILW